MSVKILKLVSGEFVIAEVISESIDSVTIKEALKVVNVFQNDKMGIRFEPFNPFATVIGEEITINNSNVMFTSENHEVINEYNRITSGIVAARAMPPEPKSKIITAR